VISYPGRPILTRCTVGMVDAVEEGRTEGPMSVLPLSFASIAARLANPA
jgi:hypothetical protein